MARRIELGGGHATGDSKMRIAVAATENDISADVAYDGGRAPFYLIFDEQGNLLEGFSNPFLEMERHAGYEVSQMMAEEGVDIIIAGLFGPIMIEELRARGIRCVAKSGSAQNAVMQLYL
jgi:predicted Fe-Mo cluster-binding NifX family protein